MARRQLLRTALTTCLAGLLGAMAIYWLAWAVSPAEPETQPHIAFEADADRFLAGEVFGNAKDYQAFQRLLVDITERHGISAYVASAGKLQPGMQVAETIEAARRRAAEHLAGLPETANRRDALVVVLVEQPRTFELLGLGSVRDTFRIRGISSGSGLRHLQLVFVLESQRGKPLVEALRRIDPRLRPLNPFIRNFPAGPGGVDWWLDWFADDSADPTPAYLTGIVVGLTKRFSGVGSSLSLTFLFALLLCLVGISIGLAYGFDRNLGDWLTALKARLGQPGGGGAALIIDWFMAAPSLIGCLIVLVYGNLSQVIGIAQQSGSDIASLIRLTRDVNQADLDIPGFLVPVLGFIFVFAQCLRACEYFDLAPSQLRTVGGLLAGLLAVLYLTCVWLGTILLFSLEGSFGTLVRVAAFVQAFASIVITLMQTGKRTAPAALPPRRTQPTGRRGA